MSCGSSQRSVSLVSGKQLRSNPDGTAKTYWSEDLGFSEAAVLITVMVGYVANVSVRFVGRYSNDGETWKPCGDGATGYIDTSALIATGFTSLWYLGGEYEHTTHFQFGIEVKTTSAGFEASVALSAVAEFGAIQVSSVDLTPTAAALGAASRPTIIPGAITISTYGCSKLRIEVTFAADPAAAVTFYLATGPTTSNLHADLQSKLLMPDVTFRQASFVVEAPDKYATVYYTVTGGTTGALSGLRIVRIP